MKPKIAVVEDNIDNRLLVQALLDEMYEISEYENGMEVLDGLADDVPELVLLDISLPGMDGTEVIERVRSENKEIFVIVITAAPPQLVCNAMKMGANEFMCKPLDINQLEKTIKNAVKF